MHSRHPDVETAIIGAGLGGLCMAIALKKAGRTSFIVLEKEADAGGTWLVNRYPGCACDVPSHLYSYSFEPNPDWSRAYSPQPEIQRYVGACVAKYGLTPHIRFNTPVSGARFDDASGLWILTTQQGETVTARFLVGALGALNVPYLPIIPGMSTFAGEQFHSRNWREDCHLKNKRVAVIGTGASAIQFVPQIAPETATLNLFQRTPPWVLPKPDRRITAPERWLFRKLPFLQRRVRRGIYWVLEALAIPLVRKPGAIKALQWFADRHMRWKVSDPNLRKKLTPNYTLGCKRILFASDYFPALTRPNVSVITNPIAKITAHGVMTADGTEYPADVIIYGTGFQASDPVSRGLITGRNGTDLVDAWRTGPEAYLGTTVTGFPNLFLVVGPNTGLGHSSMIHMIESQVAYIMEALNLLQERAAEIIEVKPEVQKAYNVKLQEQLKKTVWLTGGCQSWYLHASGKNVTLWPGFTWQFRNLTRRICADDYILSDGNA